MKRFAYLFCHSREGGNPRALCLRRRLTWIPAFAGMTIVVLIPFFADAASYEASVFPVGTVTVAPDASLTVEIRIKNTGSMTWKSSGARYVSLYARDAATRTWRHSFWTSVEQPARLKKDVRSGGEATLRFALHAPPAVGTYAIRFRLAAENTAWMRGGDVEMAVNVVVLVSSSLRAERLPAGRQEANLNGIAALPSVARNDNVESFRVAIDKSPLDAIQGKSAGDIWISANGAYRVENKGGVLATIEAWQPTRAWFDGNYQTVANGVQYTSDTPLRFSGVSSETIMIASHLDRRPAWNPTLNDNRFRGTLEYVRSPISNVMWVVNELSIEQYLEGVAEVSNGVPMEYAKAMAVAARTYAMYHESRGGKHAGEPFILKASIDGLGDDQVYRGYGFTERALASGGTNAVEAARATKGEVLYYGDTPIIAAYSSDSGGQAKDGRTVWGSSFDVHPYLWGVDGNGKPIVDPANTVRRSAVLQAASHGVGLSAAGAEQMARNGATYKEILAHYYPGTELRMMN